MARYRKWDLRAWNDQKFRELSAMPCTGQTVWMVLVLGPHTTNVPGLFEASEITICDRFGWDIEPFRKGFRECSVKGMAKADWDARLVFLPNAWKYNSPENPNVLKSWGSIFDELPECALKMEAYQTFKSFVKGLKKGFAEAFVESFREPFGKSVAVTVTRTEQEHISGGTHAGTGKNGDQDPPPEQPAPDDVLTAFERIQREYPNFTGMQDWINAEHHFRLRVEEGETLSSLIAAVERYRKFVTNGGVSGPQFVMTPGKFFSGANKPWAQPWTPPPAKPKQKSFTERLAALGPDDEEAQRA